MKRLKRFVVDLILNETMTMMLLSFYMNKSVSGYFIKDLCFGS